MTTVATVIGYMVILLVAIGVFLVGLDILLNTLSNKIEQYVIDRTVEYIKEQGKRMLNDEFWFQDADQRAMWIAIAEPLSRGSFPDPATVRDIDFPIKKGLLKRDKIVNDGGK